MHNFYAAPDVTDKCSTSRAQPSFGVCAGSSPNSGWIPSLAAVCMQHVTYIDHTACLLRKCSQNDRHRRYKIEIFHPMYDTQGSQMSRLVLLRVDKYKKIEHSYFKSHQHSGPNICGVFSTLTPGLNSVLLTGLKFQSCL